MQQNINSQCHTLGKKKMRRSAVLAWRIVCIIYYLNLILTFLYALLLVVENYKQLGNSHQAESKRIFLSDMHLYAESD